MLPRIPTAVLLALLSALPAAAAIAPWSIGDVLAMRAVHDPRVSPDGTRIVYVVTELTADTSAYQSDLWLGVIATGEQRRLTTSRSNEDSPRWSPDGRTIAFLSDRGKDGAPGAGNQVWTLSLEGGEPAALTNVEPTVIRFEWFADGKRIAYLAPEPATAAGRARAAAKDDAWLASEHPGYTRVWTVDVATRKVEPVTPADAHVAAFTVAPDGQRIVYSAQDEPGPTGLFDSDLWSVRSTGGKPTPLVQRPGMEQRPRFSPDGRFVAFLSHDGRPGGNSSPVSVCIVPAAGGAVVNLTPDFDERISGAGVAGEHVWTADSRSVLFGSPDRTCIRVYRAYVEPRKVETVTGEPGVNDWPSAALGADVLAWTHEDALHPNDVWVWEPARGEPRRFTDLNPWTRERPSFPVQVVSWPGADGQTVEGLMYLPPVAKLGSKAPLLLTVHGGPAANHAQYFTAMQEGMAVANFLQRGWALLLPNPRGSAGYGTAWRTGNRRDWGGKPYEDLMRGVDMMIAKGYADSTRLAVSGWSYGGYMTSNIVGRTNRFRAALAGAGPVDMISMAGTCDIPILCHTAMDAWPWEDPQVYLENSPLTRAGNVRTPTAFVHGDEDTRVPTSQSWEMYRALRKRGVPTDLMTLPREGHGPEEPRHLRTLMEWGYDWLARWTLAPAGKSISTSTTTRH